ncbi:hypothetical protein ET532_011815, partial [Verminephrobacter sp. Larva24]
MSVSLEAPALDSDVPVPDGAIPVPDGAILPLDSLAGEWMSREDIVHLPSLRNQWGQAHVNADLSSLSWLAMPPFSGGYHTGSLRVNGVPLAATAFRWSAWGVQRKHDTPDLSVETEVRFGFRERNVNWRIRVQNNSAQPQSVVLEQELLAMMAQSTVDWGWTYGTPWNHGHHHDFYTTERIRAAVTAEHPTQVNVVAEDARWIRLGSPRLPGIQRDEDDEPMLLETELPDHSTSDSGRVRAPGVTALVRNIIARSGVGETIYLSPTPDEIPVTRDTDLRLRRVQLGEGGILSLAVRLSNPGQTGVIVTHGNHPDSLQISVENGRLVLSAGGERVASSVTPAAGTWLQLEARVSAAGASLRLGGEEIARTEPWWNGQRWQAARLAGVVTITDKHSECASVFAFPTEPDAIVVAGSCGRATWTRELAAGQSTEVEFVLAFDTSVDIACRTAVHAARSFAARWDATADAWRTLWRSAFTPGNTEFSGYLPTLSTEDSDVARTYYLGALLALYMRNTGVSKLGPVFLTGGPRLGATTTYFWEQAEVARIASLLEPVATRAWIVAAFAQPYTECHSFDTYAMLPVGNNYAANATSLFHVVSVYLGVTGDTSVLTETAGDRSVLDHLRGLAARARTGRANFGDHTLIDFGNDAWELLECVPNYRHAVVSFNAAFVGLLQQFSVLCTQLGHPEEAAAAADDSEKLASAVLSRYVPGGRWSIMTPAGGTTIGHCLDFFHVADHLTARLGPSQRQEMVAFVAEHLLEGDWMRALDPEDPIAPQSDRPDHGAAGAFCGWPGNTARGLARLGHRDLAVTILQRAHRATSGALWGQAMEAVGKGHYRVAERGVSNRDSLGAVAVTDAVLTALFGLELTLDRVGTGQLESELGTLRNVRAAGFDLVSRHGSDVIGDATLVHCIIE